MHRGGEAVVAGQTLRPFPPPVLNVLTVDDVMAVACKEGVDDFIRTHGITTAVVPVSDLLGIANKGERDYILMAAGLAGSGQGMGYGNGYGEGYGDGYGEEP